MFGNLLCSVTCSVIWLYPVTRSVTGHIPVCCSQSRIQWLAVPRHLSSDLPSPVWCIEIVHCIVKSSVIMSKPCQLTRCFTRDFSIFLTSYRSPTVARKIMTTRSIFYKNSFQPGTNAVIVASVFWGHIFGSANQARPTAFLGHCFSGDSRLPVVSNGRLPSSTLV